MPTKPLKFCPNCGDAVTGQMLTSKRSPDGSLVDNRCSCGRIRLIDGEFYERIEDRER